MKGIPPKLRGAVPKGFAHSVWQVVEHVRIAQHDILDFCRNPRYERDEVAGRLLAEDAGPKSRRGVEPSRSPISGAIAERCSGSPPTPRVDLFATIPHGTGQTYLREVLLVADHTAYHVAQIVDIRRALGHWQPDSRWMSAS